MNSRYGEYALRLGPDEEGTYHTLICQGIEDVTRPFPQLNLQSINNELRLEPEYKDEVLPKYVGGTEAHLIVGICNLNLQPKLVRTLPSGIGLFKSPFTDIFGSRFCYGGSHKSFDSSTEVNHIAVYKTFISNVENEYNSSYSTQLARALKPAFTEYHDMPNVQFQKDPVVDPDPILQISQNATAVGERDLGELGMRTKDSFGLIIIRSLAIMYF